MLIARTFLYLPAQVIGPLAQFLAAVVWTHYLAPEALGTYAIVWAVQELVLLVVLSWWSAHLSRYYSSYDTPEARLRFDRQEIAVQLGAAVAQAGLATLALVAMLGALPGTHLVLATIAFALTRNLTSHFADRARAQFHVVAYTVLQSVGPVLGLGGGVLAVGVFGATPEVVLWSYAAAQTLGLAIALPMIPTTTLKPQADRQILVSAWRYGYPLMLGNALTWIATHAIRVVTQYDLGPEAVGLLSVGWWLGLRATTFAGLLVTSVAFNMAVEKARVMGHQAALPIMATNGAMLAAVLLPTVVGVWMLNAPLVTALVAEPYRQVTMDILPWAVLAGAIRIFRMHGSDQAFLIFERTKLDIGVSAFDAVSTVALCFIGLKLGGIHGAVIGCLVAAALTAMVSFAVARRLFGFYLRLRDLAKVAVATGLMALALWAMPMETSRIGLAIEVMTGAGVFLAALAAMFPRTMRDMAVKVAARARA